MSKRAFPLFGDYRSKGMLLLFLCTISRKGGGAIWRDWGLVLRRKSVKLVMLLYDLWTNSAF